MESAPYPRLKGKIVLITGASNGIGASSARLFAECGSHLILTARRVEKLQALKEELQKKHPGINVWIHELDVQINDSVTKMVSDIPSDLSEIDILVNNAGLALGVKHAHENDLAQINQMIDTNGKGVFYMIKAIVPGMVQRKRGHIINISSIAGLEGYAGGSGYCASKYAVQGLTMAMRKELVATPIRVTSICPGLCGNTEFSLVRFSGNKETADKVYDGITALHPDDVADNIVYVASRPPHVQIAELAVFPTNQASANIVHREPVTK